MARGDGGRDGFKGLGGSLGGAIGGRGAMVAAVDLGASKVGCFIMKADGARASDRSIHVAGVAHMRSRGVRGGAIINVEETAEALAAAVERAEAMADVKVSGVVLTTSGGQLSSCRLPATVSLGPRPVDENDLQRAIQYALAGARFPGRRPIHLMPISWSVDGQAGVKDPRGLFGRQLHVELLAATISETAFNTYRHCVESVYLNLEGVVAAPFAAGLAVLEEDEMELGAVCIDMGGGSTSAAVFAGGSLVHVDSLSVGGQHVTQDIARGLSTTMAGAERIKTLHGSAIASSGEDREMIEAPPRGDDPAAGPVVAPRSLLKGVIAPRVEETLELMRERLKAADAPLPPGAGVVLTGGASELAGVREVAVRIFDRPVRLGRPRRAPHLAEAASGPAFAAAAGALQRAAFGPREVVSSKALAASAKAERAPVDPNASPIVKVASWLRANL